MLGHRMSVVAGVEEQVLRTIVEINGEIEDCHSGKGDVMSSLFLFANVCLTLDCDEQS
jgi:hypothetical protein